MADEPEEEEAEEESVAESEWWEIKDGAVIFPHGVAAFAERFKFAALRVNFTDRTIDGLPEEGGAWRPAHGSRAKMAIVEGDKP